jgi:eukaryotic-like serine/threonine-protein kinase
MARGLVWCPHCGKPHLLGTRICPATGKVLDVEVHEPSAEDRAHPLIGATVAGKYKLERVIGRGAMGVVFEAENNALRRKVVVKLVDARASSEAAERLRREAELVGAIQHPNICDLYDAGALPDGMPFIVLERLYGQTLDRYLRRHRTTPIAPIVSIFSQVLSGLHAAHGATILHRDLKPPNIFLVERLGCPPIAKLLDFSIAKDLSGIRFAQQTNPGLVLGTVAYMAPEQLRGEPLTARADLFAVGVMLYEALTGINPFTDPSTTSAATPVAYLMARSSAFETEPRPLRTLRPEVSEALEAVVRKSLAIDPDDRWPSALELQRALRDAVGSASELPPSDAPDSVPASSTLKPIR